MDVVLDRAWQKVERQQYEWVDSPKTFIDKMICNYALLE